MITAIGPWRKASCDSELSGYDFDHEGFVVISDLVIALFSPLRPASDNRHTNDTSNTKSLQQRTQTGRVTKDTEVIPIRQLRSTSGITSQGTYKADGSCSKVPRRRRGRRLKASGTLDRSWKSLEQPTNGGDVHGEAQGVRRGAELDDLLLADDCVTDILLDDICKVTKYNQTFQATTVVRISLFSGEAHDEQVVAALSSLITSIRTPLGLDSPDLHDLRMQLALYCDMLSSDCPFELATTQQYSQHEEWCVVAKKTMEKGTQVKYLKGANATVTNATKGTYSSLGRIDGACGKRYITAGPARFVDHDCKPNSKLEAKGDHTVFTTVRNVEEGEEITVYYSADFFGRGNENCSCATCKPTGTINVRHLRRFWPLRTGSTQPSSPALSSKGCKDLRSGRLREEQVFQKAIIKQTDRILKEQSPESQLCYDYRVMKDFFKSMRPPSQDEAHMLSEEDAKELIESGAPINGPIFVSTPNLVNWTASDPLTAFFEEYSPDQMKWTVDVQTPLKLRTNADETASRMTIGQLYERFRCEGTEYLNALELANPIPSSDPEFLRGVNSRVYHRALHRCASEGKAGRTRVTDGRHWALVGQSGALSPPHEDWGGKDTFITCQRSRIGYGWFSDLSDDDRKAWHLSRQICPS
ncbi:hypothetical protein BT63DRAFT_409961 [Microthyrium microscopicum]|uniref:SET domain-containing protein n=1 Tax=Microthyrium microscopicum TaxID=703497 RepID=A0A6A6UN27_9PEZI|nr:hypothetical protein BT63DRAFT_409961 [Microthyrium microscopicum]